MTFVSSHPVSVDGVRLDTLAWGIEGAALTVGSVRSADAVLAGLDGTVPSLEDAREPGAYTLSMFVRGTDVDGTVPGGDAWAAVRANLDGLLHLFADNGHLLDVREVVETSPVDPDVEPALAAPARQFYGKVQDALTPDLQPGAIARFTVTLTNPGCYWRDTDDADWAQAAVVNGGTYDVSTLAGSTAPVDDAVVLVTGPADAGVTVADPSTGAFVRLNAAIPADEAWRVNVGTWATRLGVLTLDSDDTEGIDQAALTDQGGRYPSLLRLRPTREPDGTRLVRARVTGTGFAGTTSLSIRARRAYL